MVLRVLRKAPWSVLTAWFPYIISASAAPSFHCIHVRNCTATFTGINWWNSDAIETCQGTLQSKFYITGWRIWYQLMAALFVLIGVTAASVYSKLSLDGKSPRNRTVTANTGKPSNANLSSADPRPAADRLLDEAEGVGRMSCGSILDLLSTGHGDAIAIGATDSRAAISYATLRNFVQGMDLGRFGVPEKSIIATLMPTSDAAATLILVLFARYVAVPLNAALPEDELASTLHLFEAKVVITVHEFRHKLMSLAHVRPIEVFHDTKLAGVFSFEIPRVTLQLTGTHALNAPDDNVLFLGTSGTTSKPKIVPITLRRLTLGALVWAEAFAIKHGDRGLNMMPLYHIGGIITNMFALLISGAALYCAPKFQAEYFMEWMREFRITYYSAVPTIHQQVTQVFENAIDEVGVSSYLRIIATGAAHLPHAAALRLSAVTHTPVLPTYGMTECMPISIASSHLLEAKPDSVGRPVCNLSLFSEDGVPAAELGQQAEICVRGPLVMPSYISGGDASCHPASDFKSRWFRTGDLGVLDSDGFLKLVGRTKEVINRGGELISPFKIESTALNWTGVGQCMAFSAPHVELGEAVALAVVPSVPGSCLRFRSMQRDLSTKLGPAFIPELLVIIDELPKGATGKTLRIGFAKRLCLPSLSLSTPPNQRVYKGQRHSIDGQDKWILELLKLDDEEIETVSVTDSLGFQHRGEDGSEEIARIITCLYGVASIAVLASHTCECIMTQSKNWSSLLNESSPLFFTLALSCDWAMTCFFGGAAVIDRIGNNGPMPNFGARDIIWIALAFSRFPHQYANTLGGFTSFFSYLVNGKHFLDDSLQSNSRLWFFSWMLYCRVYVVVASRLIARPSIQIGIACLFAYSPHSIHLPLYLMAYHYGLDTARLILSKLQEIEINRACVFLRTIAGLLLLVYPVTVRIVIFRMYRRDCSGKLGWNHGLAFPLFLHSDGSDIPHFQWRVDYVLWRTCGNPASVVSAAMMLMVAFVTLSKSSRFLHYLGIAAPGTFVYGNHILFQFALQGVTLRQIQVLPSFEACMLFATKHAPNNDSPFFSVSQWISFFILLFPLVLFAATFGRLYREALILVLKVLQTAIEVGANVIEGSTRWMGWKGGTL